MAAHMCQWHKETQNLSWKTVSLSVDIFDAGVSKFGCTDLFFVKPGIKVDGRYYHREVLPKREPVNSSHGELVTCDEFT